MPTDSAALTSARLHRSADRARLRLRAAALAATASVGLAAIASSGVVILAACAAGAVSAGLFGGFVDRHARARAQIRRQESGPTVDEGAGGLRAPILLGALAYVALLPLTWLSRQGVTRWLGAPDLVAQWIAMATVVVVLLVAFAAARRIPS
jgi:hypothetical protein